MQIRTGKQAFNALVELQAITGWSRRKLARECRMSHTNLSLILEGKGKVMPRPKTLMAIQFLYSDKDKLQC